MESISLSVRVDAGCIEHNNRTFIAKNVNAEKIDDNITYVKNDLREMYTELFSEALEKYNEKQTRADRVIKNYYEHIKNGNQEKPFYEAVIQFGDIKNAGVGTEGVERAKKMLDEYIKDFEKRNPNFIVFNAVMHLDEATPHLHISFIPVAECPNAKRGLEKRVSLRKACEQMDCSSKSKRNSERQQWAAKEKEIMKNVAKKYGLAIENKNIKRPHLTVDEYKEAAQEIEKAKERVQNLYSKSDLNPKDIKKSDIDLLVNNAMDLQRQVEEKNSRILDLENKMHSDFRYIKIGDEQKINFIADNLRRKGISIVDDIDGIHVPEWAVEQVKELAKKYKPVKLTWRKEIALTIDRLIYMSKDLDSLLTNLKEKGYEIRSGKYISVKPQGVDRAVRTKSLGDEYTEENLIKRLSEKQSYLQKTEEKIRSATGIEQEFYVTVRRTVTLIFDGRKIPKKYNAAKSYSINNDWHINELASEIGVINREKISSAAELENRVEKIAANISELQVSVNEIGEMQSRIREVISKADFYFENKDRRGDAMFTAKLGQVKELLQKFGISDLTGLEPLKASYFENIKALAGLNGKIGELHKQQSSLLKLQEVYQSIKSGKYIEKITETQRKEQELS